MEFNIVYLISERPAVRLSGPMVDLGGLSSASKEAVAQRPQFAARALRRWRAGRIRPRVLKGGGQGRALKDLAPGPQGGWPGATAGASNGPPRKPPRNHLRPVSAFSRTR